MTELSVRDVLLNACYVGVGGFLGAIARYSLVVNSGFDRWISVAFVNILGCFLLGVLSQKLQGPFLLVIGVGFLGSLTTFSTLIEDEHGLLLIGEYFLLLINISGQVLLGLAFYGLGNKIIDLL